MKNTICIYVRIDLQLTRYGLGTLLKHEWILILAFSFSISWSIPCCPPPFQDLRCWESLLAQYWVCVLMDYITPFLKPFVVLQWWRVKSNGSNLVLCNLPSFYLLPNKTTKVNGLKPPKPKKQQPNNLLFLMIFLRWLNSSWGCFIWANSSYMFNRKGNWARRSRWPPALAGLWS